VGNLGFPELLVIFVIALLIFGPKKLPELGKSLGKGLKEFKRATEDLKSSWDEQMREAERHLDDVKDSVNNAAQQPKPETATKPEHPKEEAAKQEATKEETTKEVHQA
jgi:TatA/E family protein of Tat protein translocase